MCVCEEDKRECVFVEERRERERMREFVCMHVCVCEGDARLK